MLYGTVQLAGYLMQIYIFRRWQRYLNSRLSIVLINLGIFRETVFNTYFTGFPHSQRERSKPLWKEIQRSQGVWHDEKCCPTFSVTLLVSQTALFYNLWQRRRCTAAIEIGQRSKIKEPTAARQQFQFFKIISPYSTVGPFDNPSHWISASFLSSFIADPPPRDVGLLALHR